jgi:hypothetical protein
VSAIRVAERRVRELVELEEKIEIDPLVELAP